MNRGKRKVVADPRKRAGQFPEAAPFIRNRDNPVYGFVPPSDTKLDLKAELPSSLPVVRTKPIPEWKVEVKPKTSQVSVVLTDLKDSCLARNSSTFLKTLSRINSVYIHRLSQFEAINVVETVFLLIQELKDEPTFCQELIQLIRQLFLKYDIPGDLARTIYFDIRKKKDAIGLGSLLSLLETFICNGKIDAEDCADLITVAKLKLLNGTENSRLFVAKFLIACLKNTKSEALKIDLRSFLMPYCDDRCSKIRRIVIEGIEKFFEAEKTAPLEFYDLFTNLTRNADVFVRLAALRIVKLYSFYFPEEIVSENRNFPIRLTDDAFTVVCHAMNDLNVDVRCQAAKLLGTFEDVSETFLFQTLDKKLMKNMKKLADGQVASGGGSEWSTGKKLGEDCPVEAQEEEAQSMIPTGACGAFVTALEDEFKAVRQPAVYSLGKLAKDRPAFANASIGHLADMFNDEIAAVRIDAIRALTPLVTYGVLELEQLKTLLTGLDDASQESRVALMELISRSNFLQAECISFLLQRLLDTMKRFPEDKTFIFKCIASIGRRHSDFIVDLVSDVFSLHPVLQRKEEKIDDPFYLTKLILILNAASKSIAVCALLPDYVKKHYRFLKLAMPNHICTIMDFDIDGRSNTTKSSDQNTKKDDIEGLVGREYKRLMEVQEKTDFVQRERDFQQLLNDMKFYLSVESEYANASNYLYALTELLMIVDKAINTIANGNMLSFLTIQEAMEKLAFIEHRFQVADNNIKMFLLECSLVLSTIYAGTRLLMDQTFIPTAGTLISDDLTRINRTLTILNQKPVRQFNVLVKFLTEAQKQPLSGPNILGFIGKSKVKLTNQLVNLGKTGMRTVKVVEPVEIKKVQLITGLPTGVHVNCLLNYFSEDDVGNLRIKVKYFDDTTAYFLPARSDFERISEIQWRLRTNVIVVAKEGLILPAMVELFFGIFVARENSQSTFFVDRCFGFTPSPRCSANSNGFFIALPDAEDVLKVARCEVQVKPMQVKVC